VPRRGSGRAAPRHGRAPPARWDDAHGAGDRRAVRAARAEPRWCPPVLGVRREARDRPRRFGHRAVRGRGPEPPRQPPLAVFDVEDLDRRLLGDRRRSLRRGLGHSGPAGAGADGRSDRGGGAAQRCNRRVRRPLVRAERRRQRRGDGPGRLRRDGAWPMRGTLLTILWLTAVWLALWEDLSVGNVVAALVLALIIVRIAPVSRS